jgi:hypothetical protein
VAAAEDDVVASHDDRTGETAIDVGEVAVAMAEELERVDAREGQDPPMGLQTIRTSWNEITIVPKPARVSPIIGQKAGGRQALARNRDDDVRL